MGTNEDFAKRLYDIADILEIGGVAWKPQAYRKAARAIETTEKDIRAIFSEGGVRALEDIPGVGASIAGHIIEYLKSGTVAKWDRWEHEVPTGAISLMEIEGVGPSKVRVFSKLGIHSIDDLERAARSGKLKGVEGFGARSEQAILSAIERHRRQKARMPLGEALPFAERLIEKLSSYGSISYAGSLRRMRDTIGDIDLLAVTDHPIELMAAFSKLGTPLAKGETKSMALIEGVHVDLRAVQKKSLASALLYFTGNKDHNIMLRTAAIKQGYKLSEYGLFKGKRMLRMGSEDDIYRKLGFGYIPPEMREAQGELDAAKKGKLPEPIMAVSGDLHMHTTWSDGKDSVEAMAIAAKRMGYRYIAITDHSITSYVAHGMSVERIRKQWKELDAVERKVGIRILHGAEVNILANGSLDYPNALLERLEVVIGSVHTGLTKDITARVLTALENPYLDILGHPTTRMIGQRDPAPIDIEKVFQKAKDMNKVVEIDGHPVRLDPPDPDIHAWKGKVKFSLSTDSHSVKDLAFMRYGLAHARRGWLSSEDVINTRTIAGLKKFLPRIR